MAAGMDDYISKPIGRDELAAVVARKPPSCGTGNIDPAPQYMLVHGDGNAEAAATTSAAAWRTCAD